MKIDLIENLGETKASPLILLGAAALLIFLMLPANLLWTVESRWAAVTLQMLLRHDYLHPYHYCAPYYDKPLLSYWLIIAGAKIFGSLNHMTLRLPTALGGVITVWATFTLGSKLFSRSTGLIAGWLLITTFYFIFWSRTASADILTIAGSMVAVLWYFIHKDKPHFGNYFVFFLITAVTSLFKGLLGLVIPGLIILPHLFTKQEWKKHLNFVPVLAFALAIIIYLLPFIASAYFSSTSATNGLIKVFQENILRFLKPFDHQGPFYLYFLFLPIYTLPWSLFLIPTITYNIRCWHRLTPNQRWLFKALILMFLFFTLSGSRRSYYVLPLVPITILIIADWINTHRNIQEKQRLPVFILSSYTLLLIWFGAVQPIVSHYKMQTINKFVQQVHATATLQKPWSQWHLSVFNNNDNKVIYYLKPENIVESYKLNRPVDSSTIVLAEPGEATKITHIFPHLQQISSGDTAHDIVAFIPTGK